MKLNNQTNNPNAKEDFVSLLTANQRKVFAYIVSLVGNVNDADDVLQETVKVMLLKFTEFERGTDFLAWATTIAYYRILDFRKKRSKNELVFNEDIFDRLQNRAKSELQNTDEYLHYLKKCMQKLPSKDIGLIKLRYMDGVAVREISSRFGRSIQSVYRSITRIQDLLRHCIKKQMVS